MRSFVILIIWCFALIQAVCASQQKFDADSPEAQEALAMITNYQLARQPTSLAYQSVVIQQMLAEANYFAERLKLPATPHPIQMADVKYPMAFSPWYSTLKETHYPYWPATIFSNHIFDSSIPREQRTRSLKIGASGGFETTNFAFGFHQGKLMAIERLGEHEVEYYAKDLDKLVGKPSLITDSQAHGMATQWLAAVDIDVPALEKKYPPEVNRLRCLPKGSTNVVELPFYFVHWGWQYFTNNDDNHTISSTPLVEVKILGTTKEFVELHMLDTSFSRRPLLLVTNALELIRTPNPSVKHLQPNPMQNNSVGDTNATVARPPTF
jgi:hypothetical protein